MKLCTNAVYSFSSTGSNIALTVHSYPKGVQDSHQHGRGVALADFNGDGKTDIVYGNWNGPHRLYLQDRDSNFRVRKRMVQWHEDYKIRHSLNT